MTRRSVESWSRSVESWSESVDSWCAMRWKMLRSNLNSKLGYRGKKKIPWGVELNHGQLGVVNPRIKICLTQHLNRWCWGIIKVGHDDGDKESYLLYPSAHRPRVLGYNKGRSRWWRSWWRGTWSLINRLSWSLYSGTNDVGGSWRTEGVGLGPGRGRGTIMKGDHD